MVLRKGDQGAVVVLFMRCAREREGNQGIVIAAALERSREGAIGTAPSDCGECVDVIDEVGNLN